MLCTSEFSLQMVGTILGIGDTRAAFVSILGKSILGFLSARKPQITFPTCQLETSATP